MTFSEFLTAIHEALPWFVLLVMFAFMSALQWRLINALDQALARAAPLPPAAPQPAPAAAPAPPALPPQPQLPPAPVPAPKPPPTPLAPTGAFAAAPLWFQNAVHEIGFHETGNNGGIDRYIGLAHCGADGDPWCAIFANAMLELAGIPGTRSASSQSFRTNAAFVQIAGPALGAIVVYWRGSQASGLGHVGFYRGEDANHVWTLGGNENDMVQIEALPKNSATFGLIGYWWPKSVPLPAIAPVLMPAGSPIHVQTAPIGATTASVPSGVQANITATLFSGPTSAYGSPIDDNKYGVALPFRFSGARPQVHVSNNKKGLSIDCDIVDIGPWNVNDPYWKTGARPQAESGTDLGQVSPQPRKTNKAGIDLTLAAATALGVDGKALVDWQFIESGSTSPVVT